MALIKCPECQIEVSDKAKVCPKCGCPISEKGTQTVQLTSKEFKWQIIASVIVMIIGVVQLIMGIAMGIESLRTFGMLVSASGLLWHIVVKILIYWHHK